MKHTTRTLWRWLYIVAFVLICAVFAEYSRVSNYESPGVRVFYVIDITLDEYQGMDPFDQFSQAKGVITYLGAAIQPTDMQDCLVGLGSSGAKIVDAGKSCIGGNQIVVSIWQ